MDEPQGESSAVSFVLEFHPIGFISSIFFFRVFTSAHLLSSIPLSHIPSLLQTVFHLPPPNETQMSLIDLSGPR